MAQTPSPMGQISPPDAHAWGPYLPDGAISVAIAEAMLVLRASHHLQARFETLLDQRNAGTLSPEEPREYAAMGDLDAALSWLNRLARDARTRCGRHGGAPGNATSGVRTRASPL